LFGGTPRAASVLLEALPVPGVFTLLAESGKFGVSPGVLLESLGDKPVKLLNIIFHWLNIVFTIYFKIENLFSRIIQHSKEELF
jgi:hypothetical protein